MKERMDPNPDPASAGELPQYEPPRITVMNEEEVLSAFQITHAGVTWWVM
jgi:hypothetical protein